MALYTVFTPNRFSGGNVFLAEYFGSQTATDFEIISASGTLIEYYSGVDFTYSDGFFDSGTINEQYAFNIDGSLESSITGLTLSVSERNDLLTLGKSAYSLFQLIFAEDDTVIGSSGDDTFNGSKGNDTIDGGDGIDVVSFNGFDGNILADLAAGTLETFYGTSTVTGIEDVTGSAFEDSLAGDAGRNLFQGLAGDDTIDGREGLDSASYLDAISAVTVDLAAGTATGGSGNDTLIAIERVIGSRFGDTLQGSARADTFAGGFGDDTIDGRGGVDTVEYCGIARGVTVDLTAGTATGGAGNDTLKSIESVSGSIFRDVLTGSRSSNTLRGQDGNDTLSGVGGNDKLFGDAGNDVLIGGLGNDVLTGGTGKDAFRFDATLGTDKIANFDSIKDFKPIDDTIELENAIFVKYGSATGAISASTFKIIVTGGLTDANDYIVYNKSTGALYYDANGNTNGLDDATQIATLAKSLLLTNADFVLI
jgi:Ca2+-binding RTX toxin-like protein